MRPCGPTSCRRRGTRCWPRGGLRRDPHAADGPRGRRAARCGESGPAGRVELRRRVRQHRRGRLHPSRDPSATRRRAHGDNRRLRLRAADGRGARGSRGGRLVRAGNWRTWDPGVLLGEDVHGATLGIAGWDGSAGRGTAGARVRDAACCTTTIRRGRRVEARARRTRGPWTTCCASRTSSACTCSLNPGTRGADRRGRGLAWMKRDRDPDQHLARAGGGQRALVAALRAGERRRRAGRDRPRAVAVAITRWWRWARPGRATYRVRHPRDARADGGDGGRQPARRAARGTTADAGEPGGRNARQVNPPRIERRGPASRGPAVTCLGPCWWCRRPTWGRRWHRRGARPCPRPRCIER